MAPRQSEAFILLFDSNHHPDIPTTHVTILRRDESGQLHHADLPMHFSYNNQEITFFLHRVYQIRFAGIPPTDELGNRIRKITGIIVTDTDSDGAGQPYVYKPRIVYENEPSPNTQPYALLLTPYPGMEIWDTVTEEVIFSIPAGESNAF